MRAVKGLSLLLTTILSVTVLSSTTPASAVSTSEIISISEGLSTDSGMIATAADFSKFQLGREVDRFTESATKKVVTATPKPTAGKFSTLPSGYSNIPNENEEMVGFAFTSKGRAEMMIQDFFWSDVMYTVNGALDLGVKTINDVTSVPASGYKADPYDLKVGHVYAVKTRAGKYGIIQIAFIEPGKRLYFFWRYQPNGSTDFS